MYSFSQTYLTKSVSVKKLLIPFYFFVWQSISAQNVGIGITTPKARLHVADSSVVFSATGAGSSSPGDVPISGAGRRLLWYVDKAAFRAGYVSGVNWDKDSIGYASFAFGNNTRAKGLYSAAWGEETKAIGDIGSTAFGYLTIASGRYSTSWGESTKALGYASTATGYNTTAGGQQSFAANNGNNASGISASAFGSGTIASGYASATFGVATTAKGTNSIAFGTYNDDTDNPDPFAFSDADRLFQVGNGSSLGRSNALTILRNGNTGIGSLMPGAKLHIVSGSSGYNSGYFPGAIIEGSTNTYLNFLTPNGSESAVLFGKTSDAASGGIVYNNLDNADGLQFRTGGNATRMVINSAGNIGLGRTDAQFPFHFASVPGDKIALWGSYGSHYGIGIANNLLFIHTDAAASDISFGYGGWGFNVERMRVKGNGNVGIGTNNPAEKLDVAGNVKATSFKYGSPKTHYYSMQASAFQSRNSSHQITIDWAQVYFTSTTSAEELLAPVFLPDGAVVTGLTVYYADISSTKDLNVDLAVRQHTVNNSIIIMGTVTSSGAMGNSSGTDNSIVSNVIDNLTNCYFIKASARQGPIVAWPSSEIILRSVIITYTMSEAQ